MAGLFVGIAWSSPTPWRTGSASPSTATGWKANVRWKDFGTGVRLGKLKREDATSLVLYDADSEVTVDAFMPHSHPGGECYVVLEGEVWDEDGTYPAGSIVWMDRETTRTPKTREDPDSGALARGRQCGVRLVFPERAIRVLTRDHAGCCTPHYVVLEGEVWDEDGTYPAGSIVWMDRETTRGKTLILVLWPEGVKAA